MPESLKVNKVRALIFDDINLGRLRFFRDRKMAGF
tara:strand:- start:518 stop:622 length:105 start_codon:yes stop_codon:yes gene_type:complete